MLAFQNSNIADISGYQIHGEKLQIKSFSANWHTSGPVSIFSGGKDRSKGWSLVVYEIRSKERNPREHGIGLTLALTVTVTLTVMGGCTNGQFPEPSHCSQLHQ